MDLAYKIVKLGRSARNGANIKNRQPLSEMLVSTKSLPEYYGDIIKEELNIKKVEFGADLSKYVNFEIKPKDRKSTRLNSSHANISYAVFCLKKKKLICIYYKFFTTTTVTLHI